MSLTSILSGINERGKPEQVKDDYWALETKLRGSRAHLVLSLVFLVKCKRPGKSRCILLPKNAQLQSSCYQQRYFFDHAAVFEKEGGFPKMFVH